MKAKDVYRYFGGVRATARALGLTPTSVNNWELRGLGVPAMRQCHLHLMTGGELRIDREVQKRLHIRQCLPRK
jgi:DNA-binding transcriptional regulator YdaS (Cro superfamily)